ncbi:MAG: hypothetical protein EP310_09430 [Bacteroidetes bacterium]|nr:MAG: hypothetical protein EP310_09430 [Bacteroidota bacterium]
MIRKLVFIFCIVIPFLTNAQINNYWSYNFNEESSMIAGAVVGGGAGASSIFYNPAIISDINESKLSLNASLFAYEIKNAKNILGEGIDLQSTRFYAVPRSVSYMHKPRNHPGWSLEFAYLNVANSKFNGVNFTEKNIDILSHLPGTEIYNAYTDLKTDVRTDFFGAGGSIKISESFFAGTSMFVSVNSKYSMYQLDINASPASTVNPEETAYYNAKHETQEMLKFNDYRLLWKFGIFYKQPRFSAGLNITTPSVGGIYSDGKKVMRKQGQNNITNPETGEPMQNFLIVDYAEKKDVSVTAKSPFAIAAGCTWSTADNKKTLYTTVEYFAGIGSYRTVKVDENINLGAGSMLENEDFSEWLTFVDCANPIFNVAVGYRSHLKKNLMLLSGFKTDFNYKKKKETNPTNPDKSIKSNNVDFYHFTSGLTLRIKGQDITAGLQYTLGLNDETKQLVNLSHPVEFNFEELKALQGTRTNTVKTMYNSFTLLLAASFNFGGKQNK